MEFSGYSKINPQWTEFVHQYPQLGDLDKVGIKERRRIFGEIEAASPQRTLPEDVLADPPTVKEFTVKARDGYDIPVRSYVPSSASSTNDRALLVYLHAGAFMFGDLDSGDMNCRILSSRLNISVLNVAHRLAPQWQFPYGLNDSYDATEWAATNASTQLNASPKTGLFIGGISSGANYAGVIAYMWRDASHLPPITGIWLSIVQCMQPDDYDSLPEEHKQQLLSMEQNADNPLMTRKSLVDIQTIYGAPPSDPRASFLLYTDHSRLPARAFLQICGRDPLRDEGFLWEKLARQGSGTKSKIHVYQGMPHGFWRFTHMAASRGWCDDLVEGFRFLCGEGEEGTEVKAV